MHLDILCFNQCRRAALFIKQGFITQDKVKSWLTTPASTTYDDTIRSIIPKYLSPLRDDITKFVKRELEMDEDIRILSNFSIDGRDFSFVNGKIQLLLHLLDTFSG